MVEILSPSTVGRDRGSKLERYRHLGVPEYWIVDPDARAIEVWRLGEGAREPEVFGPADTLPWSPATAAASLAIEFRAVVAKEA